MSFRQFQFTALLLFLVLIVSCSTKNKSIKAEELDQKIFSVGPLNYVDMKKLNSLKLGNTCDESMEKLGSFDWEVIEDQRRVRKYDYSIFSPMALLHISQDKDRHDTIFFDNKERSFIRILYLEFDANCVLIARQLISSNP